MDRPLRYFYQRIKSKTNNVVNNKRTDNPEDNTSPERKISPWYWPHCKIGLIQKLNTVKSIPTKEKSLTTDDENKNKTTHTDVQNDKLTINNNNGVQSTTNIASAV